MTDVRVSVASPLDHATLDQLYQHWGYRGGIAAGAIVYVAYVDGQPAGIVRRTRESGVWMLRGMQVAPEHQRQRIGTKLLRAFVADLLPVPCYCVPFAHLTGFYSQGGFSTVSELEAPAFLRERIARYRVEGHSVLVMRRPAIQELDRPVSEL